MENKLANKTCLGTAQFGSDYGIANKKGKISKEEVFRILEHAYNSGIDTIDTAYSYGESEEIIGEFISKSENRFNIISKMPDLESFEVNKYFQQTLKRLKQARIYGYLVHRFDNLNMDKKLWNRLKSLEQRGLVHKIGVSLYKREELDYLLKSDIHFDIVQVPYNIFDQRFEGYFSNLRRNGIEIYTRSVFLQGLFFLKMDEINKSFQPAKDMIEKLYRISSEHSIPIYALCLCFVLLNPFIDKVIIGVDSVEQLSQNIDSIEYLDRTKSIYGLLKSLKFHDEKVILPYNWK